MPIYAYRCAACGHARDVLQKMSDAPLSVCPVCSAEQFQKQVTAAGFQLKGTGWYATDFRNNNSAAPAPKTTGGVASEGAPGNGSPASEGAAPAASSASGSTAPANTTSSKTESSGNASSPPPSSPSTGS